MKNIAKKSFRAGEYTFTFEAREAERRVRLDMFRTDPANRRRRFWVTTAQTAPDMASAELVAMALITWIRSLDVKPRNTAEATAVAESIAATQDRLTRMSASPKQLQLARAISQVTEGRASAAA